MSDTTSTRKIPSGLRVVKRTTAFGVSEDGKVGNMPIEISVHTDNLSFYIPLPEYVAKAVNGGAPNARAESASEALAEFERLCDQYSRLRLLAGLEPQPMLLVWAYTPASVAARGFGQVQGCDHFLGLTYKPVFVVRPEGSDALIFERNGDALGKEIEKDVGHLTIWSALIPDIREARDKLDALMKSVLTAATLLDSVFKPGDPLVALMNIEMPGLTPATLAPSASGPEHASVAEAFGATVDPTQGTLPLEEPAYPAPAPASEEAKPFIDPDL